MRRADVRAYIIIGTSVIVVFGGVNSKCNQPGVYFIKGVRAVVVEIQNCILEIILFYYVHNFIRSYHKNSKPYDTPTKSSYLFPKRCFRRTGEVQLKN